MSASRAAQASEKCLLLIYTFKSQHSKWLSYSRKTEISNYKNVCRHNSKKSRHFRLNSELSGAIAKRFLHAKNQLSAPGCFFNQFFIYMYKRASLAFAARLADSLWAPGVTLINYKGNNISKYVCPTVIIDIARKIIKFINF